jgi:flavin-binding protein dodecin
MVNVTTDLATIRDRVGLATGDIIDADVTKYVGEACDFISNQIGTTIDKTSCTEAEAEAIRNLAAIKCFFDVTGTSSTGWTAAIGEITFSGAPDKIAMINWLWSRVQDFMNRRSGSATGTVTSGTFKVGAANY